MRLITSTRNVDDGTFLAVFVRHGSRVDRLSTLVQQLIREAEQRGALALFGRCYESEGSIPYAPFVEMLEQALAVMPPDIVREDMGDDAPEVARMVHGHPTQSEAIMEAARAADGWLIHG